MCKLCTCNVYPEGSSATPRTFLRHLLTIGDVLNDVFGFIMLTVVLESSAEYPSASELRSGLEKGSGEVKIEPDVMGSLHWRTLAAALLLPLVAWPH